MEKSAYFNKLLDNGIFAVIRVTDISKLNRVIDSLIEGGIKNIEITLSVPNACDIITNLKKRGIDEICLGAGTVLTAEDAERVVNAGAEFVVSPVFKPEIIQFCKSKNLVVAPGCYSPTEVLTGWETGADIIKIFPANILGPKYFKDIKAVFPKIKLMPTGGVTIDNVGDWVRAGADSVGIGSDLLSKEIIANERYDILKENAKKLVTNYLNAKVNN